MPETGQSYVLEVAAPTALGETLPTSFDQIGYTTSKGISRSRETIDASSDNNPDFTHVIPGMQSFTFDSEALFVYDDVGQDALESAFDSQGDDNFAWFRLTNNITGADEFIGQVVITELSIEAATNEVVTYTISTEGVGPLTVQAVSS